jgi:hypothetical protein
MLNLYKAFNQLNDTEQKSFLLFLQTKNKRKQVKNIAYFKLVIQDNLTEKEIKEKLYPEGNYGAYHAMRKRIIDDLALFLMENNYVHQKSEEIDLSKLIFAANHQLQKKQTDLGLFLLKKAKKWALENESYIQLHQIFHIHLQYAHKDVKTSVENIIQQSKENQIKMIREEKFARAYALAKDRIQSLYSDQNIESIHQILDQVFRYCQIDPNSEMSYKSVYQLSAILSSYADINRNYFDIKDIVIDLYQRAVFNEKAGQILYKLRVLYMISNLYFRLKEFDKSMEYLQKLEKEVLFQTGVKPLFKNKILCLKALNLHFNGDPKTGVQLIENRLKKSEHWKAEELNLALSGVMMHIQNNHLFKAEKWLNNFKHSPKWLTEKMGIDWLIQKHFMEIILQIELEEYDRVEKELLKFEKNYAHYLKDTQQERVLVFLELIKKIYTDTSLASSPQFLEEVENSFDWKLPEEEDILVMSCYAWLKAKMINQPLYKTTLELVKG